MPARKITERFLVAFSFAGEERDFVRAVAAATEGRLGRGTVFFDEWFDAYIAGDGADLRLEKIYERCALAVVCVSGHYGGKPWTLDEHATIRSRVMKARAAVSEKERLAVLPIRVGEGEVKGIPDTAIVLDVRPRGPEGTAKLIVERFQLITSDTATPPLPPPPPMPDHPITVPTGPAGMGLYEALLSIFPERRDVEGLRPALGKVRWPDSDDAAELWDGILRQLRNSRADIRPLLAAALKAAPGNKTLLELYR
jgi:hypothetical protein